MLDLLSLTAKVLINLLNFYLIIFNFEASSNHLSAKILMILAINLHHFFVYLHQKNYFCLYLFLLFSCGGDFCLKVSIIVFLKAIFSKFQKCLQLTLCISYNSVNNSYCCFRLTNQHNYHWIKNTIIHLDCFFAISLFIIILETKMHYWKRHMKFFFLSHLFMNSFIYHKLIQND